MVSATWNFDSLWQLFTRHGACKIVSWPDIVFDSNCFEIDFLSYSLLSADNYAIGNLGHLRLDANLNYREVIQARIQTDASDARASVRFTQPLYQYSAVIKGSMAL